MNESLAHAIENLEELRVVTDEHTEEIKTLLERGETPSIPLVQAWGALAHQGKTILLRGASILAQVSTDPTMPLEDLEVLARTLRAVRVSTESYGEQVKRVVEALGIPHNN